MMGEGIVGRAPGILLTVGVGSCVALMLYDGVNRIGGLAHILLPGKSQASNGSSPYLYTDSALLTLLSDMQEQGAERSYISARLAGGARMFSSSPDHPCIGDQNLVSIRQLLSEECVPVKGADTGGTYGRTIEFHLDSGEVIIKSRRLRETTSI
jgi:chemotaxis protein CheD